MLTLTACSSTNAGGGGDEGGTANNLEADIAAGSVGDVSQFASIESVCTGDGQVHLVEMAKARACVSRIDQKGQWHEVGRPGGRPNGLAIDGDQGFPREELDVHRQGGPGQIDPRREVGEDERPQLAVHRIRGHREHLERPARGDAEGVETAPLEEGEHGRRHRR